MNIKVHKRDIDIDLYPVYVVSTSPEEMEYDEEAKIEQGRALAHLQALRLQQGLEEAALDEGGTI